MSDKLNNQMNRREMLGLVAKGTVAGAAALITSCGKTDEPIPPPKPPEPPTPPDPPVAECHPEELPNPTITHETELGKNDGIIKNPSNYPMEVSSTNNFSSDNFTLQPEAAKESLPAGDYYARWAENGTCKADSRIANIAIEKGAIVPPSIDIEGVTPYTEGSNQEWALWALAQTPNSAEKIRFYNFLLKAQTYLQTQDKNDYIAERAEGKASVEFDLNNTQDEALRKILQLALDDENWAISCQYPIMKPYQLTYDEITQVHDYLSAANPQLVLHRVPPRLVDSANGQSIRLSFVAYYSLAENRKKTHKKITDGFDAFKSKVEKAKVNINNKYDVAKYVYDDIARVIAPGGDGRENYVSRETAESWESILGYFGDLKISICDGYARTFAYLQNRLGLPTIYQVGRAIGRDESGNITGSGEHAWNIVNMGNEEKHEWYFLDGTGATVGIYPFFLKGRGNDGKSPEDYLYRREISKNFIYHECEKDDYPITTPRRGKPLRQPSFTH